MRKTALRTASAAGIALAASAAHADIYQDAGERPDFAFFSQDFEALPLNTSLDFIDFGHGFSALVTTEKNITNTVLATHDGYGAVPAEGDNFWKLAGGTTTFEFNQPIRAVEFMYSDLEWTTLTFAFDNGDGFEFRDSNSRDPRLLGYVAEGGDWFSTMSIAWVGKQNDGIGFDNFGVAAVPGPATALLPLMLLGFRRRR